MQIRFLRVVFGVASVIQLSLIASSIAVTGYLEVFANLTGYITSPRWAFVVLLYPVMAAITSAGVLLAVFSIWKSKSKLAVLALIPASALTLYAVVLTNVVSIWAWADWEFSDFFIPILNLFQNLDWILGSEGRIQWVEVSNNLAPVIFAALAFSVLGLRKNQLETSARMQSESITCPNCSGLISVSSKYCTRCGTAQF